MGATPQVIEQMAERLREQAVGRTQDVWPQHWHAANIFAGMSTQWRVVAGAAGLLYLGLDYAALPVVREEHQGIEHEQPMRVLMPQLRHMEGAALGVLNKRH